MIRIGLADGAQRFGVVSRRLSAVVRGRNDTRVEATWRVLLAMPVFWLLAGGVFAGNLQASVDDRVAGRSRRLRLSEDDGGDGMIVASLAWRHSGVPLEARIARYREL